MTSHNLDIYSYKFEEVLDLFHLNYEFSENDLKNAKKMTLHMHPDKSRLPPEYFLFYKKAYEIVYNYYMDRQKITRKISANPEVYIPTEIDDSFAKRIQQTTESMGKGKFNTKFNEIYETQMATPINKEKYEWWSDKSAAIDEYDPNRRVGQGQIADTMNRIRENAISERALMQYKGVQDFSCGLTTGSKSMYDDEEDDGSAGYVSCDPFAKLKFDDLRKVHKDQTVFSVSERDFDKMQTYSSIDQYNRARGAQDLTPMDKALAERQFDENERKYRERMLAKQHNATLTSMKNEQKQEAARSAFLLLR